MSRAWSVWVLVLGLSSFGGCADDPEPDVTAAEVIEGVSQRFSPVRPQLKRALRLARDSGVFRPIPSEASADLAASWRGPGSRGVRVAIPERAEGTLRVEAGPLTVTMRALGVRSGPGDTSERAVVYRRALEDTDLFIVAEADRAESFFVLDSPRAPRRFVFEVGLESESGGRLRQSGTVVEALDDQGIAWLRLVPPEVIDTAGERHRAPYAMSKGRLTVTLPAGLDRYPLLLDPAWTTTGTMVHERGPLHTATLLASGKVLVTGGCEMGSMICFTDDYGLQSAELYDPATGTWTATGSTGRSAGFARHAAVRLPSGKVLVVGGVKGLGGTDPGSTVAQLYDPAGGSWSSVASMSVRREFATATLLDSGEVLVTGHAEAPTGSIVAELFDPSDESWSTTTGEMSYSYPRAAAVKLASGKVLVCGGSEGYDAGTSPSKHVEIYDPATGSWSTGSDMKHGRMRHTATLLPSGKVLVVGGQPATAEAELYDPAGDSWTVAGSTQTSYDFVRATRLTSDQVLVAAGAGCDLYDPTAGSWSGCAAMPSGRTEHSATLLPDGGVLVAGGEKPPDTFISLDTAELYDPTLGTGCGDPADCITGHCVDGVCCLTACDATCKRCAANSGQCVNVARGQIDANATVTCDAAGFVCNGAGACKKVDGQSCSSPSSTECLNACRDQYCCNTTCTGVCMACDVAGSEGTCTRFPAYTDPDSECQPGRLCNGSGSCSLVDGQPCDDDGWCISGHCVEGVCCESACAATCYGCRVPGSVGSCTFLPKNTFDYDPTWACAGTNACDGSGNCLTALGQGCQDAGECAGDFCVDGMCCEEACTETCYRCRNYYGGPYGHCGPVDKNRQDNFPADACNGDHTCDGSGNCKLAEGQPCQDDTECVEGCEDGVCCAGTCQVCHGCNLPGFEGVCRPLPPNAVDDVPPGACSGASACDGSGHCLKGFGTSCLDATECASGYCVDDVCCDSSCINNCFSCVVEGAQGRCSPIPAGTNPDGDCDTGTRCDGFGFCAKVDGEQCNGGSECLSDLCTDGTCCDTACGEICKQCNLQGQLGRCSFVPSGSADAVADTPCTFGLVCDGSGGCFKDYGEPCGSGPQCLSGLCVDGVCCDRTCEEPCYACNLQDGLATPGTCSPIPANLPDTNATSVCDGENRCDGQGECKPASGICSQPSDCASNYCVDGFCCDTICAQPCHGCYLAGGEGICSPLPRNATDTFPADACTGDMACDGSGDGSGACKKGLGLPCAVDTDCASDHCVDEVCCDGPCDLTCESCALLGTEGTCTRIGANLDPDTECLRADPLCEGSCDGQGACAFPGIGTSCGLCKACDGAGRCVATPLDDNDCGQIECDGLDGFCRDYHDMVADRCAGFGRCKPDDDPVSCTSYTELFCGDGGLPVDAGSDGSSTGPGPDGATVDGPPRDGPGADGRSPDGGSPDDRPNSLSGSSGCGIGGQSPTAPWGLLLSWLLVIRRRRAAKRTASRARSGSTR